MTPTRRDWALTIFAAVGGALLLYALGVVSP